MKNIIVVSLSLVGIIYLLIFIPLLFLLIYYLPIHRKNESTIFQLSLFNPETNETSSRFIRLSKPLLRNHFISYRSSSKYPIYYTISETSDNQIECFGYCFCENSDLRRATTHLFSKTLYFIISAISVSLAVDIASNYFTDQCLSVFDVSECPSEDIKSEIKFCSKISENEKSQISSEDEDELITKEYDCYGHCLPNLAITGEKPLKMRDEYDCEEKEIEGKVTLTIKKSSPTSNHNIIAVHKFQKEYLTSFCKRKSRCEYPYDYCYDTKVVTNGEKKYVYNKYVDNTRKITVSLCVAVNQGYWKSNSKCKLVWKHPKS